MTGDQFSKLLATIQDVKEKAIKYHDALPKDRVVRKERKLQARIDAMDIAVESILLLADLL